MADAVTLDDPDVAATGGDDSVVHIGCCFEGVSFCGLDLSRLRLVLDGSGDDCVVCVELGRGRRCTAPGGCLR